MAGQASGIAVPVSVRTLLSAPLPKVLGQLSAKTPGRAAEEALAIRLARHLDMDYLSTRSSGHAAYQTVDVLAERDDLVFRRWHIACVARNEATAEDVARQVGLLNYFGSDAAITLCTGRFRDDAVRFVRTVRQNIRQPLILIDREALTQVEAGLRSAVALIRMQMPEALAPAATI